MSHRSTRVICKRGGLNQVELCWAFALQRREGTGTCEGVYCRLGRLVMGNRAGNHGRGRALLLLLLLQLMMIPCLLTPFLHIQLIAKSNSREYDSREKPARLKRCATKQIVS